jgi:hypothetical protein
MQLSRFRPRCINFPLLNRDIAPTGQAGEQIILNANPCSHRLLDALSTTAQSFNFSFSILPRHGMMHALIVLLTPQLSSFIQSQYWLLEAQHIHSFSPSSSLARASHSDSCSSHPVPWPSAISSSQVPAPAPAPYSVPSCV